jgi:hypothetical protein
MARVWLARIEGKHGFEKLVAIKTILPKFAADEEFQKMLLDEARIASRIEHVNVARILDLGDQHDVLYIVLEWVDGDSLSRLARAVKKQSLQIPPGILLRILADTCGGLHAAHELRGQDGRLLGVVHRDVSPQNILVSTAGIAKLIDFGIAKAKDRLIGETSAGVLKGKVRYMAPEQAVGRPTDRRADIWAMGAILYRLLSGRAPFEGENELASLNLLTAGRPPPPLPPAVNPGIRAIVSRALSHEPGARFATAGEMQAEIERAMLDAGLVTTTSAVAAFAAGHLAPYAEKRKEAVQVALAAAAERKRTREIMRPFVLPEVSTDVSRVEPAVRAALADADGEVTLMRLTPAAPPAPRETVESMLVPVSGISMRTSILAACGAAAVVATLVLFAMHGGTSPQSAAARPPEGAPRPTAAALVPPPPAAMADTPTAAPVPEPSVIQAADLPRAVNAEPAARPRPPPPVLPPAPPPTVAKPPVEAPKVSVSRRVDDGF